MDTSSRNKDDRISESDRQLLKDLLLKECKYQLDNETMDRFLDYGTVIDIPKG